MATTPVRWRLRRDGNQQFSIMGLLLKRLYIRT